MIVQGNSSIAAGGSLAVAGGASPAGQGVIDLRDGTINTFTVNGNLSLGQGASGSQGSALYFDLAGSSGSADQIVASGAVTLAGSTTVNLNPTVLGGGVANGNYTLITAAGGGLTASNFGIGTTPPGFYTFSLATPTASALVLTITGNATPGTAYWTGNASQTLGDTANNWGLGSSISTSNWSTDSAGLIDPEQVPGPITNVFFNAASASGGSAGVVATTLDNVYSINSLTFGVSAGTITSVTVNTNGNLLTIGSGGLALAGTANCQRRDQRHGRRGGQRQPGLGQQFQYAKPDRRHAHRGLAGATTLTLSGTGSGGLTLGGGLANGGGTLSLNANQAGVTVLSGIEYLQRRHDDRAGS